MCVLSVVVVEGRPLPLKFQLRRRAAPPIALVQIWAGLPVQIRSAPHPPPTYQAEAQGEGLLPSRESSPLQEEGLDLFSHWWDRLFGRLCYH